MNINKELFLQEFDIGDRITRLGYEDSYIRVTKFLEYRFEGLIDDKTPISSGYFFNDFFIQDY